MNDHLDAGRIRTAMKDEARSSLSGLTVLPETDSTNSAVTRLPQQQQHAHAILAERQTSGRGRRSRSWHSPVGGNIYLSLGWRFDTGELSLSTLPLAVAVCVCTALARAGLQGHAIKWPNDILVGKEKLAGILVELQSAGGGPALAVIGVGINVRMPGAEEADSLIALPWTDLATQLPDADGAIKRNRIAALLLDELVLGLERFKSSGFSTFEESWRKLDLLDGRTVRLEQNGQFITGTARGIDECGGLLLETDEAGLQTYFSGDVSVRRK